ncbi:MAG: IS1634 family transposase [Gammaproteobacteria bacterium]
MFVRIKKSGNNQYLQIVENRKIKGKVVQRVISTIGRLDRLNEKGDIETLVRSLSRFSEKVLLVLSGKSEVSCQSKKIGPALIFERLWQELGIDRVLAHVLDKRFFSFNVERSLFLTVLHRLFVSGSDRYCDKWRRDLVIEGVDDLSLHHLYRAMAFLGEAVEDQVDATPFSPRCTKDRIEELLFLQNRNLFTSLDLVFFDTTSIYFEGLGGDNLGRKGNSKDHRPDLNQMVVGVVLDNRGVPICSEMWPGNTTDVKTLIPIVERIRKRFPVGRFCIVADRGMISQETLDALEDPAAKVDYILGARMRKVKEVNEEVLSRAGRYQVVVAEGSSSKDPSPLKVKEVMVEDRRYIVCFNPKQAQKDAADRQAIIESLREQIKRGAKSLVGNKGYRKYVKIERESVSIDLKKVEDEARFDGKWVLRTNTKLPAAQVALKYKELWQVERAFRDMKSLLVTRPIFHQRDQTIRGHVFCSFLALLLRKELDRRLEKAGHVFEWSDIKQDLEALQKTVIEENDRRLTVRSQCLGTCGKIFQAVGVAIPPTIREM